MKKIGISLALLTGLLTILWTGLVSTGFISTSTLPMVLSTFIGLSGRSNEELVSQPYQLPPGFSLSVYGSQLQRARFLRFTQSGDLLVSRPHSGDILLLERDKNGDGRADSISTVIDDLNRPQGMDFLDDWLYIAERDRVGRIRFDHATGTAIGSYEPLITDLTGDGFHWTKTLRFGPDGLLYLAQGSTCNACEQSDQRRATIMRFKVDGSDPEIFATGLRNSVGFDWSPFDGELYATENGRDMLGDDFPPCELNRIQRGKFYGWPYFNGDNIPDPDMGPDPLAQQRTPTAPAHAFRPHNAPLGMSFVDTADWPGDYQQVALVALHGSWNRSKPDGYKVVSLHFTETGIEERDFFSGLNRQGEISGRPVDVIQGPDGAIYVSDDYAGAVYRISQGEAQQPQKLVANERPNKLDVAPPDWLAESNLDAMGRAGASLFQQYNCRSCHEQGDSPVLLTDLEDRLGYTAVIDALNAPRAPMPLFPLTEQQQRELAVYLLRQYP